MSATILDGRRLADEVLASLQAPVAALRAAGRVPGLRVILVGDDPASARYVRNKARAAARVGIVAETLRLPAEVPGAQLEAAVDAFNRDPAVHGILIQLPLPARFSPQWTAALLDRVDPAKDVDGIHPTNLGRLTAGRPGLVACTPSGCMRLLAAGGVALAGRRAVVLGRSRIVGVPMALLLQQADATVTLCHSRTPDPAALVREADVVVSAVGRPRLVTADWIKPGAAVIDVGMNRDAAGQLCGDVDFEAVRAVAGAITPVPGGVGPMTIASLMVNVCRAAEAEPGPPPPA